MRDKAKYSIFRRVKCNIPLLGDKTESVQGCNGIFYFEDKIIIFREGYILGATKRRHSSAKELLVSLRVKWNILFSEDRGR